VFKGLMII